jgi:hypothetical protein
MSPVLKIASVVLLCGAIGKPGVAGGQTFAPMPSVTDGGLVPFVQHRIALWQPHRDERRLDDIGWTRTLLEAERLGKEHGRPVFLFTLDGRMDIGRC